ncbi:WD40 repeat-like protein, partial [Tilletiaria anomala UBC 951]
DLLLSASRDKTARLWSRPAGAKQFDTSGVLSGHDGFVNACAFFHSGAAAPGISRSLAVSDTPDYTLLGHEENICSLDAGPGGSYIVSGSWDKTAKVWKDWKCVATLKGHAHAVWAVLAVDEDRILTASADKLIRLWSISSPSKPIATFSGHLDAVRGLSLLQGGKAFASCGNDSNVCIYSLVDLSSPSANQPIYTLSGHTSFAYSLAAIESGQGEVASSGEDRSVRIWKGDGSAGSMQQSITLPAVSVWSVAAIPGGDLATGSNDGVLRVFTRDEARKAGAEEIKIFDAAVASQELNKAQIGDVNLEQLRGLEALCQPGTKEGEVKMVRNGDKGEAYQWTMGSWQKIGDVIGGVAKGKKQLYQG